jgi:hypothetical protein
MKFSRPRRPNPFDNSLLELVLHIVGTAGLVAAAYDSIVLRSVVPIGSFVVLLVGLEGVMLHFRIRK